MMWATRLAIPATCQPIFDENMVLSEVLQVSSGHGETAKAQRLTNLLSSFCDILLSMSAESKWHYVCEGFWDMLLFIAKEMWPCYLKDNCRIHCKGNVALLP